MAQNIFLRNHALDKLRQLWYPRFPSQLFGNCTFWALENTHYVHKYLVQQCTFIHCRILGTVRTMLILTAGRKLKVLFWVWIIEYLLFNFPIFIWTIIYSGNLSKKFIMWECLAKWECKVILRAKDWSIFTYSMLLPNYKNSVFIAPSSHANWVSFLWSGALKTRLRSCKNCLCNPLLL